MVDVVDESCGVLYDADDAEGLPRALTDVRRAAYDEARIRRHAQEFRWADSAEQLVAIARSAEG